MKSAWTYMSAQDKIYSDIFQEICIYCNNQFYLAPMWPNTVNLQLIHTITINITKLLTTATHINASMAVAKVPAVVIRVLVRIQ